MGRGCTNRYHYPGGFCSQLCARLNSIRNSQPRVPRNLKSVNSQSWSIICALPCVDLARKMLRPGCVRPVKRANMSRIFDALKRSEAERSEVDLSTRSEKTGMPQRAERTAPPRWKTAVLSEQPDETKNEDRDAP